MKKAFTLLELVVVVIIIGVLATLGIQQYGRAIEKSRGAEAKQILGQIRSTAAAYRLENNNSCIGFTNTRAGIGAQTDQIPSACRPTHYFSYAITSANATGFQATATRCTAGGKTPQAQSAYTSVLTTNFETGVAAWTGTGGY